MARGKSTAAAAPAADDKAAAAEDKAAPFLRRLAESLKAEADAASWTAAAVASALYAAVEKLPDGPTRRRLQVRTGRSPAHPARG